MDFGPRWWTMEQHLESRGSHSSPLAGHLLYSWVPAQQRPTGDKKITVMEIEGCKEAATVTTREEHQQDTRR